jgi:hypothetical protein
LTFAKPQVQREELIEALRRVLLRLESDLGDAPPPQRGWQERPAAPLD